MKKLKLWLEKTGLTNLGYLAAAIGAFVLGSKVLIGAALGIFVYINFNVIQKLVREQIHKLK